MSDAIARLNAALEGRYSVERQLGEGGMAIVYLARDEKHNRRVALKVLKPELAALVGGERFLSEIETTASLQHPHILPLFDSGQAAGFLFYVMPYVEGESLREKLDRERQLPVDEAVGIARNVAEALDYAHRHGVIHRDVKPANILLQDGKPVVSDFGIALAVTAGGAGRLTETGLSLGTPHYMSPEQATGDLSVGGASDIYALACVLYEMLVGEPPYTGSTPQAVLGKTIQARPVSVTEVRRTVPVHIDAVIRRGLEKVPADRFASAQAFSRALGDTGFRHGEAATSTAVPGAVRPWNRMTVAFASLAALFAGVASRSLLRPEAAAPPAPIRRFELALPEGGQVRGNTNQTLALTPGGEAVIVNVATGPANGQLFARSLGSLEMVPIRGTENVGSFIVSPDGAWVAMNDPTSETFIKVPVAGGPSTTIAATPGSSGGFRGASWGDAGFIVYAVGAHLGLMRVRDVGGVPDTLTVAADGETHSDPRVLPGGETVLFTVVPTEGEPEVAALSVATGAYELLAQGEDPDYVEGGFLLFRRGNALWAAALDATARTLTSEPVPVVEGTRAGRFYAVSRDGTLVYLTGGAAAIEGARLAVVRLDGSRSLLPLAPRDIEQVVWSPDGRSVAYVSEDQIFTYDVVLNATPRQITFEGINSRPVFSPDGARLGFSSARPGTDGTDLFVKDLESDAPPASLVRLEADQFMSQWPADTLLAFERGQGGRRDLWLLDISDPESPEARPYLTSEADLQRITVSPDGRLVAYESDESGRDEVYLRGFPSPGAQTMVSRGGGSIPMWSPDGGTLYYFNGPGNPVVAARLRIGPVPVVLSLDTLSAVVGPTREPFPGALHPDGDRFVFGDAEEDPTPEQTTGTAPEGLVLVQNFVEELRRLVGN